MNKRFKASGGSNKQSNLSSWVVKGKEAAGGGIGATAEGKEKEIDRDREVLTID